MSNCGCHDTACALTASRDRDRRRVLWAVLAINLAVVAILARDLFKRRH